MVGGKSDVPEAEIVLKNITSEKNVTNLVQKTSIDQLKALISELDFFLSVDTGPIYIAEAFNVPTIDIIRPIDEKEQPPISEKNLIVLPANREKPEMFVMNARSYNPKEAKRQVNSITVQMVLDACKELISKLK